MSKTITLCASVAFYEHLNEVADDLKALGHSVISPVSAGKMKNTGDYSIKNNKTWLDNPNDFYKKTKFLDGHIAEVENGDAVLVINDTKNGIEGCIGGNVMIEIAIAYYLNKPIFILNDVPKTNPVYEEILGMNCHILHNELKRIN